MPRRLLLGYVEYFGLQRVVPVSRNPTPSHPSSDRLGSIRQPATKRLGTLHVETVVDLTGVDQVSGFAPSEIQAVSFSTVKR
jgi:hypothetical protein